MIDPHDTFDELVTKVADLFPTVEFKRLGKTIAKGEIGGGSDSIFDIWVHLDEAETAKMRGRTGISVRLERSGHSGFFMHHGVRPIEPDWDALVDWAKEAKLALEAQIAPIREAIEVPAVNQVMQLESCADLIVKKGITLVVGAPMTGKTALLKRIVEDSGFTKRVFVITETPMSWADCKVNVILLECGPDDRIQDVVGYAPSLKGEEGFPELLVVEHPLVMTDLMKDIPGLVLWAAKVQIPVVLAIQPPRNCTAETFIDDFPWDVREQSVVAYTTKFKGPIFVLKHRDLPTGKYRLPA